MNEYREFWDVPVDQVPQKTGAGPVMDCSDIIDVLINLNVPLAGKKVADVGCGTGRMARLCDSDYIGWDIAPGMVKYAQGNGLSACLLDGPATLAAHVRLVGRWADIVLCLSVFTHLPRSERQNYLKIFARYTNELLVDILDGYEQGSIAVWFADRDDFEADLAAAGFTEFDSYKRGSPDGAGHLYYHARKP